MDQYSYKNDLDGVLATMKNNNMTIPIVFFHFHSFKIYKNNTVKLSYYLMEEDIIESVYVKYVNEIIESEKSIMNIINSGIDYFRDEMEKRTFTNKLRELKHRYHKIYNVFDLEKFPSRHG